MQAALLVLAEGAGEPSAASAGASLPQEPAAESSGHPAVLAGEAASSVSQTGSSFLRAVVSSHCSRDGPKAPKQVQMLHLSPWPWCLTFNVITYGSIKSRSEFGIGCAT